MKATLVKDDVYWLGVHDPSLTTFDVVVPTPWGTTYNSYLIKAAKPALVETVRATFREEYLEKIRSVIDPLEIKYVILDHTEPDHAGALPWVLEVAPNARVVASKAASRHIASLFDLEQEVIAVDDGATLDLGGGRELKFIAAPFLHWPDTMFTHDARSRVLFTCDAFASHFCKTDAVFDDEAGDFAAPFRQYYEHIMRPFKDRVLAAVAKLEGLAIDVVATGHGPVLRREPRKYIELYKKWSEEVSAKRARPLVAVFFASTYGNTAQMAEQIGRGLDKGGVDAELRDVATTDEVELRKLLSDADGVLVGSPTVMGDAVKPVWDLLAFAGGAGVRGRPAAAFGSYGWSGEAVQMIEGRLKDLGMVLVQPGLEVNFAPDEDAFTACRDFGESFAAAVKKTK